MGSVERVKVCWGIGIALLSSADIAMAQATIPERRLDIDASVRLQYDSNVLRSIDPAAMPGAQSDDVRVTPALGFDILRPIGRQAVFLNGSVGYDFYRKNTRLNRERLDVAGGFQVQALSSCGGRIAGEYGRRRSDLADIVNVADPTNTEVRHGLDVRVSCGDAIGLQPALTYEFQQIKNSTSFRRRNNVRSHTYTVELGYTRPTFGLLSLYASYRDGSYPNRFALIGPDLVQDGLDVYSGGARFERKIGARLSGTISAGYTRVDAKLPGVANFEGLAYSGDLRWRSNRAEIALGFSRSAEQSNLFDVAYSINTTYQIDGEYALSDRLRLLAGAYHSKRSFRESNFLPSQIVRPNDRTYYVSGGVRLQTLRRLTFDLEAAHEKRDSDVAIFDYRSTRVGLTTRLSI